MTIAEDPECLKHNSMYLKCWGQLSTQRQMTIAIMGMKSSEDLERIPDFKFYFV